MMIAINLLPVDTMMRQSQGRVLVSGYVIFLVVALAAMFGVKANILDAAIERLTAQKDSAAKSLIAVRQQVQAASDETGATVGRWQQLEAIMELEERRRDQTRLLVEVEGLLPKNSAWLLSLTHNQGQISLEGLAKDQQTVSEFLDRLEGAVYIKRESVMLVQFNQDMVIRGNHLTKFSISAQTVFPQPEIMNQGLPEFGLPKREDFLAAVKAADEKLAAGLEPAGRPAQKGL